MTRESTNKIPAAMAVRTVRKVSGPASLVPYLATMKPVLHKTTKSAGATAANREESVGPEEVIPMTVGAFRLGTLPTYE